MSGLSPVSTIALRGARSRPGDTLAGALVWDPGRPAVGRTPWWPGHRPGPFPGATGRRERDAEYL